MTNRNLKCPAIILAVGLVLALVACMLTGILKAPVITEQDFPFAVTYQLDGETKTLDGVYRVSFLYVGEGTNPLERHYTGEHLTNPAEYHSAAYTIATQNDLELCIVVIFSDRTLMGDADGIASHRDPYLAVMDAEGAEYEDEEHLGKFDAEIIQWEYPEPVANTFQFAGFAKLHDTSMFAMLAVGLLVILACMIFVKRDGSISYKALDKGSVVLNFIIALVVIPVITLIVMLTQIVVSGDEFSYQLLLCLPAFTAFTVAASISLRRRGFTKAGFFIQLISFVLFPLFILL